MKHNDEKERHCLTCGKTIILSRKIRICQNCRNRGKEISFVSVGILAMGVVGIVKKISEK
ncbi:hypothetical protein EKQ25_14785 [Enterococcus faecalis]|nr:hypothetical protein [Enterococcus faecalis]